MAGDDAGRNRDRQHGQGDGEHRGRGRSVADRLYLDAQPQGASTFGQHVGVAKQHEGRNGRAEALLEGEQRDVGANSGGIAESKRKRFVGTGHRDLAIRPIQRPRHSILLAIFDEGILAHVAQQALGPDAELLFHQFHLGLLPLLRIALDGVLAADRIGLDRRA